ncbi:MtrAB system histidine kinase MtrB [Bogoriella caseilytica]|uniref:Sensor histidine kinase MtrB n=1 Tax=Bogoriella caseilytica TaxID=56055 RepID=A0A3N2BES7_9MICO|nr:MtrAB system histidine kinase MtrB [Bogoriella caseilytica]ROR73742.1 two-component system sensor histidine kinase MtrB [Bogoriella caseilytica]
MEAPPPRRLRRRARRRLVGLVRSWRTSLTFRVVVITVFGGLAAIVVVGTFVSSEIRDSLYDERVEQALGDALVQTTYAQEVFDASTATTAEEARNVLIQWMEDHQSRSPDSEGVVVRRSPDPDGLSIIEPLINEELRDLVTDEMRDAVASEGGQHWQPVALPSGEGEVPGVVVGSPITLPVAGSYELYIFYSLGSEQNTISMVMGILIVAALAVVILLGVLAGAITGWVLRPVTEAVRAAEQLATGHLEQRMDVRGKDELAVLAQSFNEMAASLQQQIERMEELSRLQQRFVSDVSHELRTPLTTIRMAGEVLHDAKDDFDPATRRSAELLQTQLDRFEQMLADLLEISRFDAGAAVLEVEKRDIRDLVSYVVELTALLADAKGSAVRMHLPEEPATADVDSRRIERVLRNLISNAIEHSDGRPIDIAVAVNEEALAVRVRDHGVGMDAASAERVFDRFWRADPARARTTGGTGLGLAISMEDVRLHGGILAAWSRPGEGASFLVTVPRRAGGVVSAEDGPLPLEPDDAGAPILVTSEGS